MNCVYNTEDYLKLRLSGEDVVSSATLYGYHAKLTNQVSGTFYVLSLNNEEYSLFKYVMNKERFHVEKFTGSVPHSLSDAISSEVRNEKGTKKWWEAVFFKHDDECLYDVYYDSLKISEKSNVTFKELIEKVSSVVSTFQLPKSSCKIFLTGDFSNSNLIRYILQKQVPEGQIIVLPESNGKEIFIESDIVSIPGNLSESSLRTNPVVKLDSLLTNPINITLPLSSVDADMSTGLKWKDVLFNMDKDYRSADLDFKIISVSVECDVFQNVFLICQDLSGNKKVVQLD